MGGSPKGTHQNLIAIVLVAEVLEGFPGARFPHSPHSPQC